MIVFPNAKINVGLYVTEKRPDGFHNLETIFYPVRWCDILEVVQSDEFEITSSGIPVDCNSDDNLVKMAYDLLNRDFSLPNIKVHLHKAIPMGAGLGGGSSDGAFMLKLLNEMFELNLSADKLEQYASILGSDCAFFIQNKPVFACGRGNEFIPVELDLSEYSILCVYPNVHVSTAEAYSGIVPSEANFDLRQINSYPVDSWQGVIKNDFEKSVVKSNPEVQELIDALLSAGAIYSSMSGSGSAVFGIFHEKINLSDSDIIKGLPHNWT